MQAIVHQSLVTPITIMGVARNIFWANALITMDLIFFGAWWLIVLSIAIHMVARHVCNKDPEFFDVLINYYVKSSDYLEG
jgi:type IV secretory pathway TrbD component